MADLKTFLRTCDFAARKHKNQRRKDPEGTPYINHPIGVAYLLAEAGVEDLVVLQAAVLHDTIEDTDTTEEELQRIFGKEVTEIVLEVTDDKDLPKEKRKEMQILHAPHCSHRAKLVKLADKVYNCEDLARSRPVSWTEDRVREYMKWSKKVLQGLRGVNSVLERRLDHVIDTYLERPH